MNKTGDSFLPGWTQDQAGRIASFLLYGFFRIPCQHYCFEGLLNSILGYVLGMMSRRRQWDYIVFLLVTLMKDQRVDSSQKQ